MASSGRCWPQNRSRASARAMRRRSSPGGASSCSWARTRSASSVAPVHASVVASAAPAGIPPPASHAARASRTARPAVDPDNGGADLVVALLGRISPEAVGDGVADVPQRGVGCQRERHRIDVVAVLERPAREADAIALADGPVPGERLGQVATDGPGGQRGHLVADDLGVHRVGDVDLDPPPGLVDADQAAGLEPGDGVVAGETGEHVVGERAADRERLDGGAARRGRDRRVARRRPPAAVHRRSNDPATASGRRLSRSAPESVLARMTSRR